MATEKVKPIPEEPIKHSDGGSLSRYHVDKYPVRPLPYTTQSICPECLMTDDKTVVIDALVYEEDGKIMYKKIKVALAANPNSGKNLREHV